MQVMGQDVRWKTTPEMKSEYDKMLKKLGVGCFIGGIDNKIIYKNCI